MPLASYGVPSLGRYYGSAISTYVRARGCNVGVFSRTPSRILLCAVWSALVCRARGGKRLYTFQEEPVTSFRPSVTT